jgi:hypothetical protein
MFLSRRKKNRNNRKPRALGIELLECREMMSVDLIGSELVIDGIDDGDVAVVRYYDAEEQIQVTLNGETTFWPLSDLEIESISFYGHGGDDVFTNETDLPCTAFGGEGTDTLSGGEGPNHLYGGDGDDVFPDAPVENYAVLFSGGIEPFANASRYYDVIRNLYHTLTSVWGLPADHIYVIFADGTDDGLDQYDSEARMFVNSDMSFAEGSHVLSATPDNLRDTLLDLAEFVDGEDHFLFFAFDHGGGEFNAEDVYGEEVLCGWGDPDVPEDYEIPDDVLAGWLGEIDSEHCSYVFAHCFSGGMLDDLTPNLRHGQFGCAATNHFEVSYDDHFAAAFVDALGRGIESTHDIFEHARTNDHAAFPDPYEDNGGDLRFGFEHPWMAGDDFPIFTVRPIREPHIEYGSPDFDWIRPDLPEKYVYRWEEIQDQKTPKHDATSKPTVDQLAREAAIRAIVEEESVSASFDRDGGRRTKGDRSDDSSKDKQTGAEHQGEEELIPGAFAQSCSRRAKA